MIFFAQQRSLEWGGLQGVLLSLGVLVVVVFVLFLLISRLKERLLTETRPGLDDDDLTLDQVRQFLRDGLITEEESQVLKEKILTRSRQRLAEMDAQRDESRSSDS